jgi:CMP-N-acetylneuraminic acid synthetase
MSMRNFLNIKKACKSRQELPIYYRLNGAIYLAEIGYLERNKNFLGKYTYAYIMPHHRSIDIDTIIDFELAQLLKKKNLKNK